MSEHQLPDFRCGDFDRDVAELALGILGEQEQARLLDHASTCVRCRNELDSMTLAADRLLVVVPSADPPPGFESRALAGMRPTSPARRSTSPRRCLAVAAVVVTALAAGMLIGRAVSVGDGRAVALEHVGVSSIRTGTFVNGSSHATGSVLAMGGSRAVLVMTLDSAQPGHPYRCQVELSDGSTRVVGTWTPVAGEPSWSVTVGGELADIRSVTVSDLDEAHSATARLSR